MKREPRKWMIYYKKEDGRVFGSIVWCKAPERTRVYEMAMAMLNNDKVERVGYMVTKIPITKGDWIELKESELIEEYYS